MGRFGDLARSRRIDVRQRDLDEQAGTTQDIRVEQLAEVQAAEIDRQRIEHVSRQIEIAVLEDPGRVQPDDFEPGPSASIDPPALLNVPLSSRRDAPLSACNVPVLLNGSIPGSIDSTFA